jgi:dTDP-3-amino-3,4,6-trideoxy-alpha-D-glucose transaminase
MPTAPRHGDDRVPYVDLARQNGRYRDELLEAVGRVLDHGQLILGPEVAALERALAERLDVRHVVTVANGTAALYIGLRLAGVGEGDEVIAPSHSFVATASAILLAGARPVLVDVHPDMASIDPGAVEAAISESTRAIMPAHLGGIPCDMKALVEIARRHDVPLVEDAAQSIGATLEGRAVGTFGIGCFSLHPLKVLGAAGDGGFIAVDDAAVAERARRLRNLGLVERGIAAEIAPNARLDTIQAAMLLVKLAHLDEMIEVRRGHAAAYRRALGPDHQLLDEPPRSHSVYSTFVVRHPSRDALVSHLDTCGIDAKVHYPVPIHRQEPFSDYAPSQLSVTDRVVSEIVSLPVSSELSEAGRERVIEAVRSFDATGRAHG